jgi:hypothetical protein
MAAESVRSYSQADGFGWFGRSYEVRAWAVKGRLHLWAFPPGDYPPDGFYFTHADPTDIEGETDFMVERGYDDIYDLKIGPRGGFFYYRGVTSLGLRKSAHQLIAPLSAISTALGLMPALWFYGFVRRHRRSPEGICRHCGYDLRATPDCCPECGGQKTGRR